MDNMMHHHLREGSLGVKDIVFFVIAAAAPLGATIGAVPVVFSVGGPSAPALFLVASLMILIFAVGLATFSRYIVSAGGFADIVKKGLGNTFGYTVAGIALLAYLSMLTGLYAQFATLFSDMIKTIFGENVPWQACILVALLFVGVLGYKDIELSSSVLGLLMILEVLILLIFDAVVLFKTHWSSFSSIHEIFPFPDLNNSGSTVALLFAMCCFVGFESTTLYGEEAKKPHKTIPAATYVAVSLIGIFFILTTFCLNIAYNTQKVQDVATADLTNFVFSANTAYVGEWSTRIMQVLVVTSVLAVLLSFHNALCRYLFSLARHNFLNMNLSKVHPVYKSPHISSIVLTVMIGLIILLFVLTQADPINQMYMFMVGLGTLSIISLQMLGSYAISAYFIKNKKGHLFTGKVLPLIAGMILTTVCFFTFINFNLLSGSDSLLAVSLPWLVIVAGVAGTINGVYRNRRRRNRIDSISTVS
ncbi:APC family permease [Klebsiella pneumoniae]|uniref:APC family permease n=1 Tax=Klebsiella pneumoniae TaxID=573 RepID=UPI001C814A36|nr:APC family permease [Klebsiella pneumoniae]MBX4531493.1 APC family permease [Klebsiella pneumoniae]